MPKTTTFLPTKNRADSKLWFLQTVFSGAPLNQFCFVSETKSVLPSESKAIDMLLHTVQHLSNKNSSKHSESETTKMRQKEAYFYLPKMASSWRTGLNADEWFSRSPLTELYCFFELKTILFQYFKLFEKFFDTVQIPMNKNFSSPN